MRGRLLVALLLLTAPLTGCLGSDSEALDTTERGNGSCDTPCPADCGDGCPPGGSGDQLLPPTWQLRDHWTWKTPNGDVTYVVTGDQGSDWVVETTEEQTAFFNERWDISTLGPIRKGDLAGSQGETRVEFFQWPLVEGETWTTTWDGIERRIEVVSVEDGTAELEAREDGRLAVHYTYDARAGSFGQMHFYDNGSATWTMDLKDWGANFTGEVVRWDLQVVGATSGSSVGPAVVGGTFEVDGNVTDLYLELNTTCAGHGAFSFGMGPNQGSGGWNDRAPCPHEALFEGVAVEDPAEGDWSWGLTAFSAPDPVTSEATILARSLDRVSVS